MVWMWSPQCDRRLKVVTMDMLHAVYPGATGVVLRMSMTKHLLAVFGVFALPKFCRVSYFMFTTAVWSTKFESIDSI